MRLIIEKLVRVELPDVIYIIKHGDTREIVGLMSDVELANFIREAQRVKNLLVNIPEEHVS